MYLVWGLKGWKHFSSFQVDHKLWHNGPWQILCMLNLYQRAYIVWGQSHLPPPGVLLNFNHIVNTKSCHILGLRPPTLQNLCLYVIIFVSSFYPTLYYLLRWLTHIHDYAISYYADTVILETWQPPVRYRASTRILVTILAWCHGVGHDPSSWGCSSQGSKCNHPEC